MCQGGGVEQPREEASMGQASTIGLDIAKWVFQAHGADATGRVVFRKRLVRVKVLEFFAGQPPCLVALEACGGGRTTGRGCSAANRVRGRIASPEVLLEAEPLPHLICSRLMFIGGVEDEADQHGGTGRAGGSDSGAVFAGGQDGAGPYPQ